MAEIQPNKKTSEETAASSLVGTDLLRVVQGVGSGPAPYVSRKTTLSAVSAFVLTQAPIGGIQSIVSTDPTKLLVDSSDASHIKLTPLVSGGGGGNPIDVAPSVPNAMDDEFDGSTLNAKWTWLAQGASSVSLANGRLTFRGEGNGANAISALEQVLPSGTSSFIVKANTAAPVSQNFMCAIHMRESATGKCVAMGHFLGNPSLIVASGSVSGGYGTVPATAGLATVGGALSYPMYYRVTVDAVNTTFAFSIDGILWVDLYSFITASFYTVRADRIGFASRALNTTGPSMSAEFFRRIS